MALETEIRSAREVALDAFEGVQARDLDRAVAAAHQEYLDDFVAIGEFHGKDAVRGFFEELFAAVPDFALTVERVVADESTVAVKWRATGTFTGAPFQGIRSTGRSIELRGVDYFEIEAGLIRRNTIYYDGASFARQIGMLPRAGSLGDRVIISLFNLKTRLLHPFRRRRARVSAL